MPAIFNSTPLIASLLTSVLSACTPPPSPPDDDACDRNPNADKELLPLNSAAADLPEPNTGARVPAEAIPVPCTDIDGLAEKGLKSVKILRDGEDGDVGLVLARGGELGSGEVVGRAGTGGR